MFGRLLALSVMLLAAGCVTPAALDPSGDSENGARVALVDGAWSGSLLVNGSTLRAASGDGPPFGLWPACFVASCWEEPTCEEGSCERVRFRVDAPEGEQVDVHVRAQSARNYTVTPLLRVLDADGEVVARGKVTDWLSIAVLEGVTSGEFEAEVIALFGEGAYQLAVVVARAPPEEPGEVRELLPDLVTLAPSDLQIVSTGDWLVPLSPPSALAPGCSWGEAIEAGARRCLRFSNGVANAGEGALEVRLASRDAIGSFAGMGQFVQILRSTDGSAREVPVGAASFHVAHGHYHYAGLATYELYAYDLEKSARGELLREGRKAGFCFYDTAVLDLTRADVGVQQYDGSGCFDPVGGLADDAWFTGVSPGFTDFYGWYLPDQFVDVDGVPDGVYELVTIADGYGTLVETDPANNAGTAVFRMTGDDVEVLWTTGQ